LCIVCQGQEAGGHRGNFSSYDPFYSLSPLLQLTRETVKTPLIAAGGIMNGAAAASTFLLGASLVQLGTAFLTTTESGAHPLYKQTLLTKLELPTTFTKTFTGKTARGIINLLMEKLSHHAIPPYPVQHFLTHQLRLLAAEKNRSDLMSLWAGQGYPLCKSLSASDLIKDISKDL
jgi:nitronate monooxygenase